MKGCSGISLCLFDFASAISPQESGESKLFSKWGKANPARCLSGRERRAGLLAETEWQQLVTLTGTAKIERQDGEVH